MLAAAEGRWDWSGRRDAQRREAPGQSFMARGQGRQGKARGRDVGAYGAARAQSPARDARAPRTMAPGRGGNAGTVALAALARRAGAVPAPEPLPARSASARSSVRSPGSSFRGRPRGALSAPPRPEPPLPLAAFSPSKFGGGRPTAPLPCFPASQARAARRARGEGRLAPTGPATLAAPRASTSALPGASSPRELSLRLPAPASARPWRLPPAALASLFLPSRPPLTPLLSTCTPPRGRTRQCAPPFPP